MRSTSRMVFIFTGLALIYGGLLLLAGLLEQRWFFAVAALGIALVLFRLTLSLAAPRLQTVLAVLSAACFLLNPLVLSFVLRISDAGALREAVLAILFCGVWFWAEHWSAFMRSLLLAGLYALALWMGSAVVGWIPVAFAPWICWNRRPLPAFGGLLMIVAGGFGIYGISWSVFHLPAVPQGLAAGPFLEAVRLEWAARLNGLPREAFSGAALTRAGHALWLFGWPLLLLVCRASAAHLAPALRDRRTDVLSFAAFLFWTIALFWLGPLLAGGPFRDGDWVSCAALAVPLLFRHVKARDFFLNRRVREVLLVSLVIGVLATVTGLQRATAVEPAFWPGPGLTLIGLLAAFLSSWALPSTRSLSVRLRGPAVLWGSYAGFCLGFASQFFRR